MRGSVLGLATALALWGMPACGDDDDGPTPASCTATQTAVGDECIDGTLGPTACAAGWERLEGGGCGPAGEACGGEQLRGAGGCETVGPADDCGTGDWGGLDTTGSVVFVNGAFTGGSNDGTQAHPFLTLAEGLAAAESGSRVLAAAGTYPETLELPAGVALEGRCSAQVILENDDAGAAAITVRDGDGAAVRGLTIHSAGLGIDVQSSTDVALENLVVDGATGIGVRFGDGSTGILGDCGLRGTLRSAGGSGIGLRIEGAGSRAAVSRSVVAENAHTGISVQDGSLSLTGSYLGANPYGGLSVVAPDAEVVVTGSRLAANGWLGALLSGDGALRIEDSLIEGTFDQETDADGGATAPNGDGVLALGGGELQLTRTAVRGNARFGLYVSGANGILGDCGFFDNGGAARDETTAAGAVAIRGDTASGTLGDLTMRSTTLDDNLGGGLQAWSSTVTVEDSLIRGTTARRPESPEGDAVLAAQLDGMDAGSTVTVTRTLLDGRGGGRLGLLVDGSTGILGDCGLVGPTYGGVWFQDHSSGRVADSVITQVAFTGVGAVRNSGTDPGAGGIAITGTLISGIAPGVGLGPGGLPMDWGDGIAVMSGSNGSASGNTVKNADRAAILFDGATGSITGNTLDEAQYGIAVQDLPGAGAVTGADATQNTLRNIATPIAVDQGLEVNDIGWQRR